MIVDLSTLYLMGVTWVEFRASIVVRSFYSYHTRASIDPMSPVATQEPFYHNTPTPPMSRALDTEQLCPLAPTFSTSDCYLVAGLLGSGALKPLIAATNYCRGLAHGRVVFKSTRDVLHVLLRHFDISPLWCVGQPLNHVFAARDAHEGNTGDLANALL